jgi:hypothetical protein
MSASGLPGNRLDSYRAGMRATIRGGGDVLWNGSRNVPGCTTNHSIAVQGLRAVRQARFDRNATIAVQKLRVMTWRLYALVSGGAFVATYLFSGQPGTPTPARAPQARPAAASPSSSNAENEIQLLAARLEARVRQAASYQAPTRNPFEFGHVPQPAPKQVIAPKLPELPYVPPPPPPPPFTLSGIAANHVDGALQRTGIFSGSNGVQLAREGESVGGYKVVTIDDNAALLESPADGRQHRLTLSR